MVDGERLAAWMDNQELPGSHEPIELRFLSGGSQNHIYEVRRGDTRCVIRIPPAGAPADRDEGIYREWRIVHALDGTDVPHTAAVAVCTDATVLGRPFYLMGFVDGWSPMSDGGWAAPYDTDATARAELGYRLAEGIALLSKVDWRARGLGDLGRPDGFHERQVERWTSFLERVKTRDIEGMEVATQWLRARRPIDYIPGIMHGDYQFANVMFNHGRPARLAALVDWEMGTVGDPKLDLGWMVQRWPADPDAPEAATYSYVNMQGMPTQEQVVARYAEVSGRQVDDLDYYIVLARWKMAIILERGYARAGDDPKLQAFGRVVQESMRSAAELAESSDYR